MIDRLKVDIVSDLSEQGAGWCQLRDVNVRHWKQADHVTLVRSGADVTKQTWRVFEHRALGVRITGPWDFGPRDVEFSAARVLFGDNGRLIRSQGEIEDALCAVGEILGQVSPDSEMRIKRIRSIELCWHFQGDPRAWIPFYSLLKHPKIEGFPVVWRHEFGPEEVCINMPTVSGMRPPGVPVSWCPTAVTWNSRRLRIKLYDKVAERNLSHTLPPVMRLEFKVSEELTAGLIEGGSLSFAAAYCRFRELAGMFRSFHRQTDGLDSPIDFLLMLRARGVIPEVDFSALFVNQSKATQCRWNARARSVRQTWELEPGIAGRLPPDQPPDAPDVIEPDSTHD